jgi:hypothetical protein
MELSIRNLQKVIQEIFTQMKIPDPVVIEDEWLVVNGVWAESAKGKRRTIWSICSRKARDEDGFIIGIVEQHSPMKLGFPSDEPIIKGKYFDLLSTAEAVVRLWIDHRLDQILEDVRHKLQIG